MGLYKSEPKQNIQPVACYTGYAINERILLHTKSGVPPTELGKKTFHCLRRFTLDAIPNKCNTCVKDINCRCFFLNKHYYSTELVALLVKFYGDNAKLGIGDSHIWDFNKYYHEIIKAMENPITQKPEEKVDYMKRWEDKHDIG
jgi:hypothetical protein